MIIGLTGRAGSGKTYAQKTIESLIKIEVIDLDKVGHECLKEEGIKKSIVAVFGEEILEKEDIDRKKLGKLVFEDTSALSMLNALIHPKMTEKVKQKLEKRDGHYLIVGALLNQLHLQGDCDHVIVIDATDEDILNKRPELKPVLQSQNSRQWYQKSGAFCIYNNFNKTFKQDISSVIEEIQL